MGLARLCSVGSGRSRLPFQKGREEILLGAQVGGSGLFLPLWAPFLQMGRMLGQEKPLLYWNASLSPSPISLPISFQEQGVEERGSGTFSIPSLYHTQKETQQPAGLESSV